MAEGKKSFILYSDLIQKTEHLTFEEKGVLFTHLLEYVNDLNPTLNDRILIGVWKPIELQLKSDLKLWERKQKQRSEAGKRSAESRKRKSTVVNGRSIRSTKSTVNVNVNDNVSINTYTHEQFVDDWNLIRTEVLRKPTKIHSLSSNDKEVFYELGASREDTQNALKGFFKQQGFPKGQDYTVNPSHFLKYFNTYLLAFQETNANIWVNKE